MKPRLSREEDNGAIQHGTVTVSIADVFAPPAQAGNLGPEEVRRIAKAPRRIGLVCDAAADALDKSGTTFAAPAGVTPASLRTLGKRAEGIDQVFLDLDVVLRVRPPAPAPQAAAAR